MKTENYVGNSTKTGVYGIFNLVNGKVYIGSTKKAFHTRKTKHLGGLKNNNHFNLHLQAAYNKYGEKSFIFRILYLCDTSEVEIQEANFIKLYNSNDRKYGYNKASVVEYKFGYKHDIMHHEKASKRGKERASKVDGLFTTDVGYNKSINVYDLDGKFIEKVKSGREYCKKYNSTFAGVSTTLTTRKLKFKSHIILFSNDVLTSKDIEYVKNRYSKVLVSIYDLNDNLILEKIDVNTASKFLDCKSAEIRMCGLGYRSRIREYKIKYEGKS